MVRRLLAVLFVMASIRPVCADVSSDLQRQIRASTFEVVMSKPADTVTYEKPLPLELLPFIERTDRYRSMELLLPSVPIPTLRRTRVGGRDR